ncbi:hypothetical protein BAUCODRAFT_396868 [Baudoinia panamericana UAMH 10762]|uniref:CFEM domain-containing protein n=1 Tax=Baudoinia panamericana (strain UAMH 10762) TaxID=717646 RepID=M2MQZ9_BAUPA|nr:uncharacterized protein BAUCODRAFT_396868 [Baudoinia panamericana UAMH 10762]EMC99266.1 hypothetical protein BAUCODRAFT_396868 [Baudoinia panamericana UAMH 10762]
MRRRFIPGEAVLWTSELLASKTPSLRSRSPLEATVPVCALPCLTYYLQNDFPNCARDDLACLCSRYSTAGNTLGEQALICVDKECPPTPNAVQQDVYYLCTAVSTAVPVTHTLLTIPATVSTAQWTSSAATPSATALAQQISSTSQGSSQTTGSGSSSHLLASTPTSTAVSTVSSTPAGIASPTTGSSPNATNLTSAQAVGVSVACFGALAIIVAMIWLCACLRRRKAIAKSPRSRHSSYDFIDEAPSRLEPFYLGTTGSRGPYPNITDRHIRVPETIHTDTQQYQNQMGKQHSKLRLDALGLNAVGGASPDSLRSSSTRRTVSQLLPEKPGSTPPRPPRSAFRPPPQMGMSPQTVFEEHMTPRAKGVRPTLQPTPPVPTYSKLREARRSQGPEFAAQYTGSPEQIPQPTLSLQPPKRASRAAIKIPSPIIIAPPPPVKSIRMSGDRTSRGSQARSDVSSAGGASLLDYYSNLPALEVSSDPPGTPFTPISLEPQRRMKPLPGAIVVTRPTYPPRAVRRPSSDTCRSETSFESTDPDEPTPPEEDKQLSPVAESPIATIKYPKIPRSSNQSVPRSPPMHLPSPKSPRQQQLQTDDRATLPSHAYQTQRKRRSPRTPKTPEEQDTGSLTLSGWTAVERQGGDSAISGLQKRLVIDTSHSRAGSRPLPQGPRKSPASGSGRQESPLKGYGRVATAALGRPSRTTTDSDLAEEKAGLGTTPGPQIARYVRGDAASEQVMVRSPLWEPKLTPTRRGEDLMLEVGVASPGIVSPGFYGHQTLGRR